MDTPKRPSSDRGKQVSNDPFETNKTSTELSKINQNVDQKQEIAMNVNLNRNEGRSKGESSKPFALPLNLSGSSSRRPIMCKFCGQTFASTQALGGHQNAHKQERDLQKALKVARDFRNNPFLNGYNFPGETLAQFPGSYFGRHPFGYHPYPGYAQRAFQAKSVYSHPVTGLPRGPPGVGQARDRFKPVGAAFNSGWPTPYDQYSSRTGPMRRFNGPTNFNAVGERNMTAMMQATGNDARIPQNYNIEASKTDSRPICNESLKLKSAMNQNESAELDLNLKL